jgi:hypothetical protein
VAQASTFSCTTQVCVCAVRALCVCMLHARVCVCVLCVCVCVCVCVLRVCVYAVRACLCGRGAAAAARVYLCSPGVFAPPPPHTHTWFLPPHARGLRAPHTGASQHALAAETTGEVAEKLLKINTLAPIRLTQAALPLMLKR